MSRITVQRTNENGYLTLNYLVDDNPINVMVRMRDRPEKVWLRIDQFQIALPDFETADQIARSIVVKISLTEKENIEVPYI